MTDVEILRVVIREDFSEDMADQLIHDILSITEDLASDSAAAHLAHLSTESHQPKQGDSGNPNARNSNLSKNLHKPAKGRGHKSHGYAKQC
jgi:glutamate decarboxylase